MKLLLKREYGKHSTRGTVSLNGNPLCKTLEPSISTENRLCPEGLYRLACDYDEDKGWHLYFEADGRRIEIRAISLSAVKDCIVPITCFKESIPLFTRLACRKLTERLMDCMEEGEEVWLEIYSVVKLSKPKRWRLNPQNTLQAQEG